MRNIIAFSLSTVLALTGLVLACVAEANADTIGPAPAWRLTVTDGTYLLGSGNVTLGHGPNRSTFGASTSSSHYGWFSIADQRNDGKGVYGSLLGSHHAIKRVQAPGGGSTYHVVTLMGGGSTTRTSAVGRFMSASIDFVVANGPQELTGLSYIYTGARMCRADNIFWHTCGTYVGYTNP